MGRITARAGRLEALIDRTLDPTRATRAGGFLQNRNDKPRARATTLPGCRTGIGDFGPLLYYRADDATITDGVMTVPNRTGMSASLTSSGQAPALEPFMPESSDLSIVFEGLTDTKFRTPALGALLDDNLSGDVEIVLTLCMTAVLGGASLLAGNVPDLFATVPGSVLLYSNASAVLSASRVDAAAGFENVETAPVELDVVRIVHLVVRKTGAATAVLDTFINGVRSNTPTVTTGGGAIWAGAQLCLGADDSGTYLAPAMRLRDIAVYPRELTRDERMAMFSGVFAENPSIPAYPRLEDVIDLSGVSYRTFHPDRAPRVAGGNVLEVDDFDGTGTITRGVNDAGRHRVTLDGVTAGLDDQEAGFITTPADSISLVGCVKFTNLGAFGAWLEGFAAAPPLPALSYAAIACDDVGGLRAVYDSANFYLAGLGDISDMHATGVLVGEPGTGTFYGSAWDPGDTTYTTDEETIAMGGVPAGTTDIAIGNIRAAPLPFGGDIFGGALILRVLTANEINAVQQYFFQEFND